MGVDVAQQMRAAWVGMTVVLAACTSEPERVFVPGGSFEHQVEVSTSQGAAATVHVGEDLVLHARRLSGPWKEVARKDLAQDACWVGGPPERVEREVADNIQWIVSPEGQATFNLDLREDHTRTVRFSEAGRYELRAVSKIWCSPPVTSNGLTVSVEK